MNYCENSYGDKLLQLLFLHTDREVDGEERLTQRLNDEKIGIKQMTIL